MIMPRYRRSMAIRPVNRIKHVVDASSSLAAGVQANNVIVGATDTPSLAVTNSVQTGSKVNGIYLRVEIAADELVANAIPNCYLLVTKIPGGNLSAPDADAVGSSDNKRFVIHQEMVMFENRDSGNGRTLFNGVIVIPKGYRRFAPNDTLVLSILSPSVDIKECHQVHYKEFR